MSAARLEAQISTADLATGRPVEITVMNPAPSLDISKAVTLLVDSGMHLLYLPVVKR